MGYFATLLQLSLISWGGCSRLVISSIDSARNGPLLGNSKGDPWVLSHSPLPLPSKTLTLDKGQGFEQGSRFSDPYPYPSVKPFTTLEGFHVKEGHIALAMSEQVLFSVYKAF